MKRNKRKQSKYIVHESFCGTKSLTSVFVDIIMTDLAGKGWINGQQKGIIKLPTGS